MGLLRVLALAFAAFVIVETLMLAGFNIFFKSGFMSVPGMFVLFCLLVAEFAFLTFK